MKTATQLLVQRLQATHAAEIARARALDLAAAGASRGAFRTLAEEQARLSRDHAERLALRLADLADGRGLVGSGVDALRDLAGQAVAVGRGPLAIVRGSGREERVLAAALEQSAAQAGQIAAYRALERIAERVADPPTAALARELRAEEERALERLARLVPALAEDLVRGEVEGLGTDDLGADGTDALRLDESEGVEEEMPIARYDGLSPEEIVPRLGRLSQRDLERVEDHERAGAARAAVLEPLEALRAPEPWAGYDDQSVAEIKRVLTGHEADLLAEVRDYERGHRDRASVVQAAERELAMTSS